MVETITPWNGHYVDGNYYVCRNVSSYAGSLEGWQNSSWYDMKPSIYLKFDVKVISGNGDTEPYVLK